ncbi:hypothetical protein KHS38_07975 [Mucilaginibacter sp. Bleaf8]|uniref:hypothetical protein n=1 Tax=Mucilaginibacter sp. Bleaf8 TaxID=2834430 RepID=UPI001BCD0E31|nr:hypothetical protein [Mucilaginibacter sp. Bleaf8]MBS7564341.1 hypothetical protein [Mucilaginibacter sp. Bleaf8]
MRYKTLLFTFASILFACASYQEKAEDVLLYTSHMQKAPLNITAYANNSLIAVYEWDSKSITNKGPFANVFICKIFRDSSSEEADTVILLDTHVSQVKKFNIPDPSIYWVEAKSSHTYKSCRVFVPKAVAEKMKFYKYRFASVRLVTDD